MYSRYLLTALFVVSFSGGVSARPKLIFWHTQFKEWFPAWGPVFNHIRDTNCSAQYHTYLTGDSNTPYDWVTGGDEDNKLSQPLVDCMLGASSPFITSSMTSASVLLGLAPSLLSLLGPSIEEVAVLVVIGNRQLLSLLLVGASPAVFPDRAFKLESPTTILHDHEGRLRNKIWAPWIERSVTLIEYVVAIASITNLAHTCYLLDTRTVSSFAPQIPYFPVLWTWIGICNHLVGCWSMHIRVRFKHPHRLGSIWRSIKGQFQPICEQSPREFTVRDESYRSIALSWLSSIMVMVHLIFGSLIWSSLLFIGVGDSIRVITRFLASALATRGIIMYELSMLRHIHNHGSSSPRPVRFPSHQHYHQHLHSDTTGFQLESPAFVTHSDTWRGRDAKGRYNSSDHAMLMPTTEMVE